MYIFRCFLFRSCIIFIIISILIFILCSIFSSTTLKSSKIWVSYDQILSSTSVPRQINIPEIFDISLWRTILIGGHGNQTKCHVPQRFRPIADAYCRAQGRNKCPIIPCTLIYRSNNEWTETVECLRGGKPAIEVKPDWICRKSPALELLSNRKQKPSLRAEGYTTITSELYGQALAPYRDEETSKWGLTLIGESIGYYPSVAKAKRVLPLFDITLGYDRRYFDVITDVHLTDYVDQITNKLNQRLSIEQVLQDKVKDRASILWINNNCNTPSNRTGYMLELMRYIRVDIHGRCGNSKWNKTISTDPKMLVSEKMNLSKQYRFTIAIENSLEYDYVTEKLWQPLVAGSVPIYLGAPNIDDWLPCSNYSCIINLRQFSTIQDAAHFINELVLNKEHYIQYHQWRNEKNLPRNFMKMIEYFQEANKHTIECLICDMVYRNDHGTTRRKLLAAHNPFEKPFPSLV